MQNKEKIADEIVAAAKRIDAVIGEQPLGIAFSAVAYYFIYQLQTANLPALTHETAAKLRRFADLVDTLHPPA